MSRYIDSRGNSWTGVIDLAVPHPSGGYDPEAPQSLTEMQVTGQVATGHTASLDDPSAPILVREADISGTPDSGALYVEGRCRGCIARTAIFRSPNQTLLVLEHRPGCTELAALLAEVPR